jgi:TolB protein
MNPRTDEGISNRAAISPNPELDLTEGQQGAAVTGQARLRLNGQVRWLALALIAGIALSVGPRPLAPATAAFPGANGQIAFHTTRDGNFEIYAMNPDGSNPVNLTNHPADDAYPAWSPDGSKIVFQSSRNGNAEIYVMNADGSGQTRLTFDPAGDYDPAWSPDGAQIAFASIRDSNFEVYVMNADGAA